MQEYIKLSEDLKINKLIPIKDSPYKHIKSKDKSYYTSLVRYTEEDFQNWQKTNSVGGIKDSKTNKVWFDLDSKADLSKAFDEGKILYQRLTEIGMLEENIQLAFSGNKGLSFIIELDNDSFTTKDVFNFCNNLAGDLSTFDSGIYDNQRVFRLLFTKHKESGLFKIPITKDELFNSKIDEIKELAKSIDGFGDHESFVKNYYVTFSINQRFKDKCVRQQEEVKKLEDLNFGKTFDFGSLDLTNKPSWLDTARWYLQNGFFQEGERSYALLCLAATYKNFGFEKGLTYRLLKGVAELMAQRTNTERYPDSKIHNEVLMQVYGPNWKNGQYSLKDPDSWLYQYARKYNLKTTDEKSEAFLLSEAGSVFKEYCQSFYDNRIYTGLEDLDKEFPMTAGSNIGIIGSASSGKTALSLNILENTSKQNVVSIFASLDMSRSRLYEKMLYKVTNGNMSRDQIFKEYIDGNGAKYDAMVKEMFPNVYIFNKSAPTVDQLRDYILEVQDKCGEPVRLLMIDYFERLSSERSDDTSASKDVANAIQDIVNDFPRLVPITLVQPNKVSLSGGPDKPILNYTAIKGSSFLYQSFRQILSLWRPFFNPKDKGNDKFMEMAILKNDLGELGMFKYNWRGKTGSITTMNDLDEAEYDRLIELKRNREAAEKAADDNWKD